MVNPNIVYKEQTKKQKIRNTFNYFFNHDLYLANLLERVNIPLFEIKVGLYKLNEAKKIHRSIRLKRLIAPIMVFLALRKITHYDDNLPTGYEDYSVGKMEHIDINGDKKIWSYNKELGRYAPSSISYDLDNEDEIKLCYWTNYLLHPRSFIARFIWLGIRNRVNGLQWKLGKNIYDEVDIINHRTMSNNNDDFIEVLYTNSGVWQIRRERRILKYFTLRENYGYKLNNIRQYNSLNNTYTGILYTKDGSVVKATPIFTKFSIKRYKEK